VGIVELVKTCIRTGQTAAGKFLAAELTNTVSYHCPSFHFMNRKYCRVARAVSNSQINLYRRNQKIVLRNIQCRIFPPCSIAKLSFAGLRQKQTVARRGDPVTGF